MCKTVRDALDPVTSESGSAAAFG